MERVNKFLFWFFVIVLAFLPFGIIMTFALLILYYGVPYIKSELQDVSNFEPKNTEFMNEYSDDTLDKMK